MHIYIKISMPKMSICIHIYLCDYMCHKYTKYSTHIT